MTNALSQQTVLVYDPTSGKLKKQTDPNGVVTSWSYDTFARKNLELRPDGTSTTWTYQSCATAGCVNGNNQMEVIQAVINTDNSNLTTYYYYYDQLDRLLVTSKPILSGTRDRYEVQYDSLGNVHQQSAPCTFNYCTPYWTVNTYDLLNRLSSSTRPISASNANTQSTTYAYQGRSTTVTDAQGKNTTTITEVTLSPGRTTDANGYAINYKTDAFGSILSVVDSASKTLQTTSYLYGLTAFPQSSTDVDLGSRTYTTDALGELTKYTDAKSQSFTATYDALSRPLVRQEPDTSSPGNLITTTWTWGSTASSDNIGKLQNVTSVAAVGTYTDAYTYDTDGRLSDRTLTLPGEGSHSFDYTYNTKNGLLQNLVYPASAPSNFWLSVDYLYGYGILWQLYDGAHTSTVWWQQTGTNIRGQTTQETTEDLSGDPQIVANHNYDAVTGWLSSNQTGVSSGSALQNESYLYDLMGNVTQRQNNNAGLTENFYYENLYRLDHSVLGSTTNLQMCYDNTGGSCTANLPGPGNITSRSDIAGGTAWTYDTTHLHAVTQAGTGTGNYTYTYDANGNAITRNGLTYGWTSYNYPSSVQTSTESASFDYGPDRSRWRMMYTGSAGLETTYYATPLFEKVIAGGVTDYRHYIYANNKPVMVISRTSAGAITVRSLLFDHQGSVASIITDSTGAALVNESFTAFGNRREASTWSGAPTSGELTTMNGVSREGYTFQTVLGSMGLNHMNGRIQDAVTGRFLSADPRGLNPSNTQSFNRYSYVGNNPLSFTDPTGFEGEDGTTICTESCDGLGNYTDPGPGGNGPGVDVGPIDPGPPPDISANLPPAPLNVWTGSRIPGAPAFNVTIYCVSSCGPNSTGSQLGNTPTDINVDPSVLPALYDPSAPTSATAGGGVQTNGAQGVPVVSPDGTTVPDQFSATGNLMSPVADLSEIVVTGHMIGSTYSSLLNNPETSAGAINYLGSAILGAVGQGGTYDYQRRKNPFNGKYFQLPQFRDVSNFNVGLLTQAAGLTLNETLSYAGDLAYWESSNYSPNQPYGLNPRTAAFITLGYTYGQSGAFGP